MFIDSHTHLFYEDFHNDLSDVIHRAREAGVSKFVVPSTNVDTLRRSIELSDEYDDLYVCAGFHPLDLEHYSEAAWEELLSLLLHEKVVAIGEIGLDYFYKTHPQDLQKRIFSKQIALAIDRNLPIVVHTRDSINDAIDIVEAMVRSHSDWRIDGKRGVFHCFSGEADHAQRLFDLGFLVSYPGIVTFKKSNAGEVIQKIGYQHIMLETDAPFLAPVPHRGKRNEPSYIPLIAESIAKYCAVSIREIADVTTRNAITLFNLPSAR